MKSFNLNTLVRENVKKVVPYSSARDEFTGHASIYLDANENPFNTEYNRYPDPHQIALKRRISELKSIAPEFIFLGNGSDEPIDLLFRAFCEPGMDNVVIPQPTYGMYSVSAAINGVNARFVSLTSAFDIDVEAVLSTCDDRSKLLFLCSPNNPSGNLLGTNKVQKLLESFQGIVVLDEAYIDFIKGEGFVPRLSQFKNLVILQTLSKAWGLAGLRLGMCFASPAIIEVLNRIKPPYNISSVTQQIALKRLEQPEEKDRAVAAILLGRDFLSRELQRVPMVTHIFPSDANFLLVRVIDAKQTYASLVQKGIVVRDRSNVRLCDECLRITVGTTEENQNLIQTLKTL